MHHREIVRQRLHERAAIGPDLDPERVEGIAGIARVPHAGAAIEDRDLTVVLQLAGEIDGPIPPDPISRSMV